MDRYIYVRSNESKAYFENNQTSKFKIHLNLPLFLPGIWKVALVHFSVKEKSKSKALDGIYIYSDLWKESIVRGQERPLLRRIEKNKKSEWNYVFDNPCCVPV